MCYKAILHFGKSAKQIIFPFDMDEPVIMFIKRIGDVEGYEVTGLKILIQGKEYKYSSTSETVTMSHAKAFDLVDVMVIVRFKGVIREVRRVYMYFKRLSSTSIDFIQMDCETTLTIGNIKSELSQKIGVDKNRINIVNGFIIKADSDKVEPYSVLDVVVNKEHRTIPEQYKSSDVCMIIGESPAVKMPCGHSLTQDSLYDYCRSELAKEMTTVICCAPNCQTEWEYPDVEERADLSIDEKKYLGYKINQNILQKDKRVHQCPECYTNCERKHPNNDLVECTICKTAGKSQFEFCWKCNKSWKEGHNCGKDDINHILATCEMTTMQYSNMKVPSTRLCPKCGILLQHAGACKTMTCKCKHVFCFSCLQSKDGKDLSCGGYNGVCTVAPRQQLD